ncbi:hypothetical protein [Pontibacter beigongshangensis]|uniref:hypothetical protein n=1 Tax=Pontibacter beigongshangensis TaxID=2574733 RepID=UPI001650C7C7|nr:hypothetical protein [Pontibacter beigongshangensis]
MAATECQIYNYQGILMKLLFYWLEFVDVLVARQGLFISQQGMACALTISRKNNFCFSPTGSVKKMDAIGHQLSANTDVADIC